MADTKDIPAFPHPEHNDDGTLFTQHPGMTLRDWFAGQALVGFTSCGDGDGDVLMGAADTASAAYNYADAMIAEREKRNA